MAQSAFVRIEVYFTPPQFDERQYKEKNIVVIDVLRSSTTIAMALQNGAREIIPVKNIENALKISGSLDGEVTLRGGERQGKMIEGFDLGNSPAEYTQARVKGKAIILLTSNGSPAMVNGRNAKNLIVAGFVNLSETVRMLQDLRSDFAIICAGQDSRFSLEDSVCAGKIVNYFTRNKDIPVSLNDGAAAAMSLDSSLGGNLPQLLNSCEHGKYLGSLGYAGDIEICGSLDSIPVLPTLTNGIIRLAKPDGVSASTRAT